MATKAAAQGSWMAQLQSHKENISFALATGDLTYVHLRGALATLNASNPSFTLAEAGASDDVEGQLKQINANTAMSQQQAFEDLKTQTDSMKQSQPDAQNWQDQLSAKKAELKKKATDAIDTSFDKASKYIASLPPQQQKPAASIFSTGADVVAQAASFVFGKIEEVVGAVADFLKGIWNKVTEAYDAVKDYVGSAISHIKGLFSSFRATHLSASGTGLYQGSLTWKQNLSTAQAGAFVESVRGAMDVIYALPGGSKPEYNIVNTSISQSDGECTANVLYNVSKNVEILERDFKGMYGSLRPQPTVSWSIRGSNSMSPSGPVNPLSGDKDCSFTLTWKKSGKADQDSVEAALDYLQRTLTAALEKKHEVHAGAIEETSKIWTAEMTCRKIRTSDVERVSTTMKKVFKEEVEREAPLVNDPKVPTPDHFTYERSDV